MADINIHIPNYQFRKMVVDGLQHEPYEAICHVIIDLVEEIAGDAEASVYLNDLIEQIQAYLPEEE